MVNAIMEAHNALQLADEVTGAISGGEGELEGRRATHWSYYLLIAGSVVGAIAAVAGAILMNIPLIVVGGLFCLTCAIGAYYIKKLDTLRDLEDYVAVMKERITEMSEKIKKLSSINEELKKLHEGFEQNLEGFEGNLEEAKEVWDDGYKRVQNETEEIARLTKELEATTKKLKILEKLYKELQDTVNLFSSEVSKLGRNSDAMSSDIGKLADHVTDSEAIFQRLDQEDDEYDGHVARQDELNKASLNFLEAFIKEIKTFVQIRQETLALQKELDKKEKSIKKSAQEIKKAAARMEVLHKLNSSQNDESRRFREALAKEAAAQAK